MAHEDLERMKDSFEDKKAAYGVLKDTLTTTQHFVVWVVGIASAGMLGCLSSAKELREMSRLDASLFAILFALTEVLFVASIVVAVIFHRYCTKQLMFITAQTGNVMLQASIWRESLVDNRTTLTSQDQMDLDRLRRRERELESDFDKMSTVTTKYPFIQYTFVIAAYCLVAVMFVTSRP
jgi:hypothetical protein